MKLRDICIKAFKKTTQGWAPKTKEIAERAFVCGVDANAGVLDTLLSNQITHLKAQERVAPEDEKNYYRNVISTIEEMRGLIKDGEIEVKGMVE